MMMMIAALLIGGVVVTMDLLRRALTASLEQELFNQAVVLTVSVSFLRT